jgi:hypothetical protein
LLNYRQLWFLDKFLIGHKGFIAGGCFKNIFNKERIKDIDIFFENESDFKEAKKYFKNKLKTNPSNWKLSYENKKVWAIYSVKEKVRIELIRSVFGNPQKIIDDFDFTLTKFAYYKNYENLDEDEYMAVFEIIYHPQFFEHLSTKRLVLDDKIPFPISTFNRSYKYAAYGYGLCRESKIKLVEAVNGLENIDLLELGKSLYDGKD